MASETVKDPVCEMTFKPSEAVARVDYDGATYYFCSQDCAESFEEEPADFL